MINKKKKKGFTLIELVIVLAVLAIIALIAIPNFNKVRIDSQIKADKQTCETIKDITMMAIVNEDLIVKGDDTITVNATSGISVSVTGTNVEWKGATTRTGGGDSAPDAEGLANFKTALKEVSSPQQKNQTAYTVSITDLGDAGEGIEVSVGEATTAEPTPEEE